MSEVEFGVCSEESANVCVEVRAPTIKKFAPSIAATSATSTTTTTTMSRPHCLQSHRNVHCIHDALSDRRDLAA
jgi:hypothetical protein